MAAIMNTIINCFQKVKGAEFRVVFVLGGPGSGKGTMCAKIVDKYGWAHLSAGDLLRAERKDPTSKNGELINDFIKEGKIAPAEITRSVASVRWFRCASGDAAPRRRLALIRQAMEASGSRNFLIDGSRAADNLQGWEANMADCADVARAASSRAMLFAGRINLARTVTLVDSTPAADAFAASARSSTP
ncbi:cytidylate kinase [Aureococcus anophagefferens]|nr:cytidylate kinase [Aureococcus anophagefferens]